MESLGPLLTVERVAALLAATGQPWFWFDGAAAPAGEPRVSYLGLASEVREAVRGSEREFLAGLRESQRARTVGSGRAAGTDRTVDAVRADSIDGTHRTGRAAGTNGIAGARGPDASVAPDSSAGPDGSHAAAGFASGWVVALGYELGVGLLGLDPAPDAAAPGFALRADAVVAVAHDTGRSQLLGQPDARETLRCLLTVAASDSTSQCLGRAGHSSPAPGAGREQRPECPGVWRGSRYEERVEVCRAAIRDGDAYVLCLTDTAETRTSATPLELYERLRGGAEGEQAAMRGGVIALADRALASASPERFLSVRGRAVSTHPIKGTRPRGVTADDDARLAAELLADPKERAENLMIVDLMRNDFARVCEPGSVSVSRFLALETHPRVHQLVSTVVGELAAGRDVFDAIVACFPGGSMTGAPKRSAVEILQRLEGGPRGLYSGCFGWIDDSGDAELAMTIRGVELRAPGGDVQAPGSRALVGAGGGITIDSDPRAEREERDLKAAAMLSNL